MLDPNNFSAEQIQRHKLYFEEWLARKPAKPITLYQGQTWDSSYVYVHDEETGLTDHRKYDKP